MQILDFQTSLVKGDAGQHMARHMFDAYVIGNASGNGGVTLDKKLLWSCENPGSVSKKVAPSGCHPDVQKLRQGVRFDIAFVDCWVRLATLDDDARRCVSEWARGNGDDPAQYLGRTAARAPNVHKLEGASCADWYTPELAAGVMRAEKAVAEFFNYTKCCGAAGER